LSLFPQDWLGGIPVEVLGALIVDAGLHVFEVLMHLPLGPDVHLLLVRAKGRGLCLSLGGRHAEVGLHNHGQATGQ
jgi:hypothetical protein